MAKISVKGVTYLVTDELGFQGGYKAKEVQTPDGLKIAVKQGRGWRFWTVSDRLQSSSRYMGQLPQ